MRIGFRKLVRSAEFPTLALFIAMIVLVASIQGNFFTRSSLENSIISYTPMILLAMGQAIVLLAGGLDLSSGTGMALILCVMTSVMKDHEPGSGAAAILLAIGMALVIGFVNGFAVGYLRLPAIVATFATSYIWLGLALFILPTPGGGVMNWIRVFYDFSAVDAAPEWMKKLGDTVPTAVFMILLGCAFWYFVSKTKTGRYIYAVGSDRDIAFSSGVRTSGVVVRAYLSNAFFMLLCALFFAGQNQAGSARMGDPMALQCIAAAVVGGVALTGGKGNVYMAIVGAVILSLINKLIFFANVPTAWQVFTSGLVIIVAISVSSIIAIRRRKQDIPVPALHAGQETGERP
jgi:ribose transport system permease protein